MTPLIKITRHLRGQTTKKKDNKLYNMERITGTDELQIYNKPNNMLNEL